MFKQSLAVGLIALLNLVQGTILPARAKDIGAEISLDHLSLLSLVSSEIVNRQRDVAQSSNSRCTNSSGFEITNQGDLDALSSCSTINGNIIIDAVALDTVTIPSGVQKVSGDLRVTQISSLTSFQATNLESITGTFELVNLTGLTTLSAPSLTSVGSINFVILPLLQSMNLGINEAGNVRISDTQLSALTGLSLSTVSDLGIGNIPLTPFNSRQQSFPQEH
jgi:hypothetical protein